MWPVACFYAFVRTGSGGDFQVSEPGKEPVIIRLSDEEFCKVTFAVRGQKQRQSQTRQAESKIRTRAEARGRGTIRAKA